MVDQVEARLKRLAMRSWRRGTKEMDLILGPFSDAHLRGMGAGDLALYEALLEEGDPDLLPWMLGQVVPPARHAAMVGRIVAFARVRLRPDARPDARPDGTAR